MTRRHAILGAILAPLLKLLAVDRRGTAVAHMTQTDLAAFREGVDSLMLQRATRAFNERLEDLIINGYDPVTQVYDNGEPVDHEPGPLPGTIVVKQ